MLYMEPLLKLDDFSVKLHTEHVDHFIHQEDLTTKKKNS